MIPVIQVFVLPVLRHNCAGPALLASRWQTNENCSSPASSTVQLSRNLVLFVMCAHVCASTTISLTLTMLINEKRVLMHSEIRTQQCLLVCI